MPVFWVGLPSVRGQRSTSDMVYLNELYRTRAEKAGIVFVDVWDGFVDEGGRFALQGPDFEGQIRRLRTGDGVHFTKAGARKLAHYVEREIQRAWRRAARWRSRCRRPSRSRRRPRAKPGGPTARPLAGPVMPLTAAANAGEDGLLGGADARPATDHVTVTRVLVKGEAVAAPAGRGDDFAWPRRGVAPFGTDPAVATTTLPLPVMQARAGENRAGAERRRAGAPSPPAPRRAAPARRSSRRSSSSAAAAAARLLLPVLPVEADAPARQRGSVVVPIRNLSIAWAHWRPSRIAHTTSDWPRRMSPAANTFGSEVW